MVILGTGNFWEGTLISELVIWASHEAVVSTFETVLTNLERVSDCFHTV